MSDIFEYLLIKRNPESGLKGTGQGLSTPVLQNRSNGLNGLETNPKKKKKREIPKKGSPSPKTAQGSHFDIKDLNGKQKDYSEIMKFPGVFIFVGKPKQGKTFSMTHILRKEITGRRFKFGLVMSGTAGLNKDFSFLPKDVIREFNESDLEKYIAGLKQKRKKLGDQMPENFLVLDDCVGLLDSYNPVLQNLCTIHRHLKLTIFICVQYINSRASGTILRECVTRAIIFRSKVANTLKALWDSFGQGFDNKKQFKHFFFEVTNEEHKALLYRQEGIEPEQTYYSFKVRTKGETT